MIKLTENQLFDFANCPSLFEMKYVKKLPMSEETSFSQLLNKVSNYFYLHLLNGKVCSLAELKKKWDSICESHQLSPKQAVDGMHLVAKFANWMGHEQPIVLDINTPYTICMGNVELSGNLLPVFRVNEKKELIVTDFSSKMPDQRLVDMKLKYTLDAYVCKTLFKEDIVGIRVHNVKNDKEIRTYRNEADFNRLISSVKGIGTAIKSSGFYARDSFMCPSCPAFTYCRFWTTEGSTPSDNQ